MEQVIRFDLPHHSLPEGKRIFRGPKGDYVQCINRIDDIHGKKVRYTHDARAAEYGNYNAARALLELGADVDAQPVVTDTPHG